MRNKKGRIKTLSEWVILGFLMFQHISYYTVMKDFLFPNTIFGAIHLISMCSTFFLSHTWWKGHATSDSKLHLLYHAFFPPMLPATHGALFLKPRWCACLFRWLLCYCMSMTQHGTCNHVLFFREKTKQNKTALKRFLFGQLRMTWKSSLG